MTQKYDVQNVHEIKDGKEWGQYFPLRTMEA